MDSTKRGQLCLLLWKDFTVRKRKLVTICAAIWACIVIMPFVIVRHNIVTEDVPTCSFPARALPSVGMMAFLQSFICTVNNECQPMSSYEIPRYETSKLHSLSQQIGSVLGNETIMELVSVMPNAIKLVSTLARVIDEPDIHAFARNGIRVKDLFVDAYRVKQILKRSISEEDQVLDDFLTMDIDLIGLISTVTSKSSKGKCNADILSKILKSNKQNNSTQVMADKLCNMAEHERKYLLYRLAPELNYKKYVTMIGNIIKNVNGDNWLLEIGEMISAMLRLLNIEHYMPEGLHMTRILDDVQTSVMQYQNSNFTYLDTYLLNQFVNLFEPTFGDTKVFQNLQGMMQMLTRILKWISNFISKTSSNAEIKKQTINSVAGALDLLSAEVTEKTSGSSDVKEDFNKIQQKILIFFANLKELFDGMNSSPQDTFQFITQAINGLIQILPASSQHQFLFYSTLLAKLVDNMRVTVHNNLYMEQLIYNATLKHREVIPIIIGLSGSVVNHMFAGLADDDRVQILTGKIYYPRQLFCDVNRLQAFLNMNMKTVEQVRHQFCNKLWINYVSDLIRQFGIMDIRTTINDIASLVVAETLHKDISDKLYTVSKTMSIFENFVSSVKEDVINKDSVHIDWSKLLNVSTESPLLQVFKRKASMSDEIIIAVHLALAREVIKQNPILESQVVATFTYGGILVQSLYKELNQTLPILTENVRRGYMDMIKILLTTGLEEEKVFKLLSSDTRNIFCKENATFLIDEYLSIPEEVNGDGVIQSLCKLSQNLQSILDGDSELGRTVLKIRQEAKTTILEDINWSAIIESFQHLYVVLNDKLGYNNMTNWKTITDLRNETKLLEKKWSQENSLGITVRLSLAIFLKGMDILDSPLFNMTSSVPWWNSMKRHADATVSLLNAADYFVQLFIVGYNTNNSTLVRAKLPFTVSAVKNVLFNLPALLRDGSDIFVAENIDVTKVGNMLQSTSWPCNGAEHSLSIILPFGPRSSRAVRGMESLFCIGRDLQAEWRNVTSINKLQNSNTTSNETTGVHTFLQMSEELNNIIRNMITLEAVIIETISELNNFNNTLMNQDNLVNAWRYAIGLIADKNKNNHVVRIFTFRIDTVLSSLTLNEVDEESSASKLWEGVSVCMREKEMSDECREKFKACWISTLKFVAVAGQEMVFNLNQYFQETNELTASTLQKLGFTKRTPLYILFDKLPDIAGVLLNSYLDQGFMNQIRKATKFKFWDCDAVVDNMLIPLGSRVQPRDLQRIKPYLCPSLLFWVSIPTKQNTLFDLFASTQNLFYNTPVGIFKPNVTNLFTESLKLHQLITASNNVSIFNKLQDFDIKSKFNEIVDLLLNWNVTSNNSIYHMFIETNIQQSATFMYLSQITLAMNHISESISKFNGTVMRIDDFSSNTDIKNLLKLFKRRPSDFLEIIYNIVTDAMRSNSTIIASLDKMCDNLKSNKTEGQFLTTNVKMSLQLCSINYQSLLVHIDGLEIAGNEIFYPELAFKHFVTSLKNMNVSFDATGFNRTHLQAIIKYSIKYAGDLNLPVYLQYLDSVLEHYTVVLSFISGEDWWSDLRKLYSGPYAKIFFESLEKSIDIVEDLVSHMDKIKLVRLMKDINVNNTNTLCSNISLSNYIPDSTGMLTRLKNSLCSLNQTELFREIKPLAFASQGYESTLKLSKTVNESLIIEHINILEKKMEKLLNSNNRQNPQFPYWINTLQVNRLKRLLKSLNLKETQVDIGFGITANLIDALTFFGRISTDSDCRICSTLTTWVKQVNLQLFKKDEYETLLCHIESMSLKDVYAILKNNLHWDMALREVTSKRNYTPAELNKSLNQLLETSSIQLHQSILANTTKLNICLINQSMDSTTENAILSNITFYVTLAVRLLRMVEAVIPHIHEMEGVNDTTLLRTLYVDVTHHLPVYVGLSDILSNVSSFMEEWRPKFGSEQEVLKGMQIDISKVAKINNSLMLPVQYVSIEHCNSSWIIICSQVDCSEFNKLLLHNINYEWISSNLDRLRNATFWSLKFISKPLASMSQVLQNVRKLLEATAHMNLEEVVAGRVEAILDFLLHVLQESTLTQLMSSLKGLLHELEPLLSDTDLEADLRALSTGLLTIKRIKDYVIDSDTFKIELSNVFTNHYGIEINLHKIGINNTNFWSMAAEKVYAGHIDLKNILRSPDELLPIRNYVCDSSKLSTVLIPAQLGGITTEDVVSAVSDQFCPLSNEQVIGVATTLFNNINFTYIGNKIMDSILMMLYSASSLSTAEGQEVMSSYRQMLSVLPSIEKVLNNMSQKFKHEPLFAAFNSSKSIGDLLETPHLLTHLGIMLCGKAIPVDENRLYKIIAETEDFTTDADPRQLDSLPTEFCQNLYRDILKMNGGKIVWTFVKPLIMGKILYTPENNVTRIIMEKVNTTFARMNDMRQLVFDMSDMFLHIEKLALHQRSLRTMQLLMESSNFYQLVAQFTGSDVRSADSGGLFIGDVIDKLDDIRNLSPLIEKLSDLLACINLNRIHPVKDEHWLEITAGQLTLVNEFSAGIVFLNMNHTDSIPPKNIEYKIRMDIDNVPTTTILRNRFLPPGPRSNFMDELRYFRGFIQVQDMMDQAIIEFMSSVPKPRKSNERSRREISSLTLNEERSYLNESWAVYTQQMPYSCYKLDTFQSTMYESQALLVGFFFALILTVSAAVRFIVWEKESGNTMLMSVMGLRSSSHTLSWFLSSFVEMTLAMTLMMLMLKIGHVLPYSDSFVLWLILINFGFSIVTYCYMISKLFFSASLGSVCASIIYLLTYMPFTIILSLEIRLSLTSKILTALSMSTAFSYILMNVGRYEVTGEGVQWHNINHSPVEGEPFSILHASMLIVLDTLLYAAVGSIAGLIIDKRHTISSINFQESKCITTDEGNNSNSKVGVSISKVSMLYKDRTNKNKQALDNVSIDLYCGEITTLLGHNGAGKTTLIKILTGMLKPTSGTVNIPLQVDDQGQTSAVNIGMCPQNDVLLDALTAEEHLYFYARLKTGLRSEDVRAEVESMLSVLDFGTSSWEPVHRLSGGMRRRLCVSIAFVSCPQLVVLDEPSSGVDPLARRDIWSLIVRLKEDRTVLLTTHHLDEAELLSDRVIIMHRGQIYTSGSPVALKNTYGSGYNLRVIYPTAKFDLHTLKEKYKKELSVEESAKDLVAAVRKNVKNGKLRKMNGKVVEIELPFLSDDGVSNDFLSLTQDLEEKQHNLGFITFSIDCTSLEKVFFKICDKADGKGEHTIETSLRDSSHSVSSSSSADDSVTAPPPYKPDNEPLIRSSDPLHGSFFIQLRALVRKRLIHYSHNFWLLCILLVLPMLFVGVALVFARLRPPIEPNGLLMLEPGMYTTGGAEFAVYPKTIDRYGPVPFGDSVMHNIITDSTGQRHKRVYEEVKDEFPSCKCENGRQRCSNVASNNSALQDDQLILIEDNNLLQDWITTTNDLYIAKRYGGWSLDPIRDDDTNLIVWYDNTGHHSLPAFLNAVSNAVLQCRTGLEGVNITTYSHPMRISSEPLSRSTVLQHLADLGVAAIILVGFSLIPAANTLYLVNERVTEQKRLQLLCRVTLLTYWLATFIWDMLIIVINVIVTICLLIAFGMEAYTDRQNLYAIAFVLILFGFSCNSLSHVLEKLFTDASMCNLVLFCSNVCLCCSGITILFIIDILSTSETALNIRWYLHKIFLLSPQFAMADAIVEIAKNSIQAAVLSRFGMDTYQSPLYSSLLLYHYTALVIVGLCLFILNVTVENRWLDFMADWRCKKAASSMDTECEELEVATERYRVELSALRARTALPMLRPKAIHTLGVINADFVDDESKAASLKRGKIPEGDDDILQTISLRKEYGAVHKARVALQSLTFGVKPGQCFGLLGVNGAGKSSTFRMLTGQTRPTSGEILLASQTMNHSTLCNGNVSYCPQSDALDPLLTTRQQLQFYCQLRGITNSKEVIRATLEQLDLTKYENQRIRALSGGNKRKLCTAISLMGKSAIVLLDEPTSGMDPAARRATARAIRAACALRRSVVLTTHSLAESEALCTRVAVLAEGAVQALGSPTVLKDRFGGGYLVSIRLTNSNRLMELVDAAQRQFPQSVLQCAQYCTAQLLVPVYKPGIKSSVTTKLSDLFRGLTLLNSRFDVEDYTINESSLDQMFINFINLQMGKKSVLQPNEAQADKDEECTAVTFL